MTTSKQVLGPDDVRRAVTRMAHEIIERNRGLAGVALIGLQRGGVWLAEALGAEIARIEHAVPVGSVDASLHRDDIGLRPVSPGSVSEIPFPIDRTTVVLVDDVLFTGRTVQGRARRDRRVRPAAGSATRRDGRPRPPRAADPSRLRRQEPADEHRGGSPRHARRRDDRRGGWRVKHLRSIAELGADGMARLLDLTDHMAEVNRRPNPKVPALRGKTVCMIFFEDSTRTRLSFETAAKRLSADTMTFSVGTSSVNKGESLRDTIETVAAMGVDAFVIRHGSSGTPWQVEQLDQLERHQRRRRLARAPDPGVARLLHDPHRARPHRRVRRLEDRDRRRHQAQPSRAQQHRCVPTDGRRRHARRTAHVAPAGRRAADGRRSRRRDRRRRRALPAAHAARADDRGAGADAARVHGAVRSHAAARTPARQARTRHASRAR